MTHGKFVVFALALTLAACGRGTPEVTYACPQPFTVQDAERLTHFKDGPGRDPRDIAYEASIVGASAKCSLSRNQVDVTLFLRVSVSAGPSAGAGRTSVPYFVRVLDVSQQRGPEPGLQRRLPPDVGQPARLLAGGADASWSPPTVVAIASPLA